MTETRQLTLNEKRTLICALADERTRSFAAADELHEAATDLENSGQRGFSTLDGEAELHENVADIADTIIEMICDGRVVILKKGE
jgi:hypothetical protein